MNTEWLHITILILSLMNQNELQNTYEMSVRWEKPESIHMHSHAIDSALVVDFRSKDGTGMISTFLFFPCNDYVFINKSDSDISVPLPLGLFAVTHEMIIYKLNALNSEPEDLIKSIKRVFAVNEGSLQVEEITPLPDNIQILQYSEYPHHTILSVAIPGSGAINPQLLSELFPGKMILFSLVPDIGPIRTQWIRGAGEAIPSSVTGIFRSSLEEAISLSSFNERQNIFIGAKEKLINLSPPLQQKDLDEMLNELDRYLFFEQKFIDPFYDNDIFGNYQPKRSPDTSTDFMPGLQDDLLTIPEASYETLISLIEQFQESEKNAIHNPGKWVEGNMVLGARPDEYIPSKEELILDEIGNRIKTFILKNEISRCKKNLRKKGLWGKTFCYTHYTFCHADVMGSGRFFYVNTMIKKCFTLKDGGK